MTDNARQKALEALDWIEEHSDDPQLNKLKGLYIKIDAIRAALQIDLDAIIQEIDGLKYAPRHYAVGGTPEYNRKALAINKELDQAISIIRKHQNKECEETKGGA